MLRPAFQEIRAALAARGFRFSRRLGQNFLIDASLHECIVAEAGVVEGDAVLEVGSGAGFLTAHLLGVGARVLGVEIDRRLVEDAREVLGEREGWKLLHADVLDGKQALRREVVEAGREWAKGGVLKVVANLPYSISGPLLALLALADLPLGRMVCLVQKEVGARLAARPGGKEWGALGFVVATRFSVDVLREVPARSFRPQPRVDSVVVRFEPLGAGEWEPGEAAAVARLGRALFTQRGRTVRTALRALKMDRYETLLAEAGLGGGFRVRQLGVEEVRRLVRFGQKNDKNEA